MQEAARDKTKVKKFHCSNPDCGKAFDKTKIIKFCPHCYTEIKEEKSACPHFLVILDKKRMAKEYLMNAMNAQEL